MFEEHGLSGLPSDDGLIATNDGQDESLCRMIESSFRHYVTAGVAKLPSHPVLTVVVLTGTGGAHRGDFYDPAATGIVDAAGDRLDAVDASRDFSEPSQLVHLYQYGVCLGTLR